MLRRAVLCVVDEANCHEECADKSVTRTTPRATFDEPAKVLHLSHALVKGREGYLENVSAPGRRGHAIEMLFIHFIRTFCEMLLF